MQGRKVWGFVKYKKHKKWAQLTILLLFSSYIGKVSCAHSLSRKLSLFISVCLGLSLPAESLCCISLLCLSAVSLSLLCVSLSADSLLTYSLLTFSAMYFCECVHVYMCICVSVWVDCAVLSSLSLLTLALLTLPPLTVCLCWLFWTVSLLTLSARYLCVCVFKSAGQKKANGYYVLTVMTDRRRNEGMLYKISKREKAVKVTISAPPTSGRWAVLTSQSRKLFFLSLCLSVSPLSLSLLTLSTVSLSVMSLCYVSRCCVSLSALTFSVDFLCWLSKIYNNIT